MQLADNPLSESERTAPISARNQRLTAVTNALHEGGQLSLERPLLSKKIELLNLQDTVPHQRLALGGVRHFQGPSLFVACVPLSALVDHEPVVLREIEARIAPLENMRMRLIGESEALLAVTFARPPFAKTSRTEATSSRSVRISPPTDCNIVRVNPLDVSPFPNLIGRPGFDPWSMKPLHRQTQGIGHSSCFWHNVRAWALC